MPREFEAEALRDGVQAARERVQAEREMDQTLLEPELRRGSAEGGIEEQSTTGQDREDGTDVVSAGPASPSDDASGDHVDTGTTGFAPAPEYEHGEYRFEGDGRHALDEQ